MQIMSTVKLKLGHETETLAGFLLWQVSKLWQRRLALALRDLDLAPTQAVLLANVLRFSEEGEDVTQALLGKAAKVDRMTTSQTLRSLEAKRLIIRQQSKKDSRTHRIQLTPQGRDTAFKSIARLAACHEAFFLPLRGERRRIVSYLQELIRANDFTDL